PGHKYFVAVRSFGGPGQWTLTFHHVPQPCAKQGELVPGFGQTVFLQGTTCNQGDDALPSCSGQALPDANYVVYQCPSSQLHVTTCDPGTTIDSFVNAVLGSMTISGGRCVPIAGSGKEVDCSKGVGTAVCRIHPTASELTMVPMQPGLVTVNVE